MCGDARGELVCVLLPAAASWENSSPRDHCSRATLRLASWNSSGRDDRERERTKEVIVIFLPSSKSCGTPTPADWPEVIKLPNFQTFKFKKTYRRRLKEDFSRCVSQHTPLFLLTFDLSHSQIPESALDLMDRMLTLDPSRRLTASEALQHPFLSGFDKDSVPPPV